MVEMSGRPQANKLITINLTPPEWLRFTAPLATHRRTGQSSICIDSQSPLQGPAETKIDTMIVGLRPLLVHAWARTQEMDTDITEERMGS